MRVTPKPALTQSHCLPPPASAVQLGGVVWMGVQWLGVGCRTARLALEAWGGTGPGLSP